MLGGVLIIVAVLLLATPPPALLRPKPAIVSTRLAAAAVPSLAPGMPSADATPAAAALVNGAPYQPQAALPTTTPTTPPRMLIPSLGLDESVLTIPIVDGSWDLSQLDTHIGWLSTTGNRPGDTLAMAFIGHYTVTATRKGALADLWQTRLEDEIIYRVGGFDYVYAIKSKVTVRPDDVTQLYVDDGRQLLLVTCTDWNYLLFKYNDRLIVQAELLRQVPAPP